MAYKSYRYNPYITIHVCFMAADLCLPQYEMFYTVRNILSGPNLFSLADKYHVWMFRT